MRCVKCAPMRGFNSILIYYGKYIYAYVFRATVRRLHELTRQYIFLFLNMTKIVITSFFFKHWPTHVFLLYVINNLSLVLARET